MTAFWNKIKKTSDDSLKSKDKKINSGTVLTGKEKSKKLVTKNKENSKKKVVEAVLNFKEKAELVNRVIIQPIISENAMVKESIGKYVFLVSQLANKKEVAEAVMARYGVVVKPGNLTDVAPQRNLLKRLKTKAGRSRGKISIRHRGGGVKRKYRLIDFKMDKFDILGKVVSIEKDPYRSALIALVVYKDGEKRYVLATQNMKVGKEIVAGENVSIKEGNRTRLKNIPVGTLVSNVEMIPGKGGQIGRSAGASLAIQSVDGKSAQIKMASGEIRLISSDCYATIGTMSNFEHNIYRIGKAGRKRHMGWRPAVRGSAMNPVDHPHGGGEGRQPIGLKHPKTPWGKPALGKRTRRGKRYSDKYIIKRRKK